MKLGSWNILEQELLKSFLDTNSDGRVYALAAGYLGMVAPNRADCEEEAKGISIVTSSCGSEGQMSKGWWPAPGLKAFSERLGGSR
jgi:hypothetical protein